MEVLKQNINDYINYCNILKDEYLIKHNEIITLNDELIKTKTDNDKLVDFSKN